MGVGQIQLLEDIPGKPAKVSPDVSMKLNACYHGDLGPGLSEHECGGHGSGGRRGVKVSR